MWKEGHSADRERKGEICSTALHLILYRIYYLFINLLFQVLTCNIVNFKLYILPRIALQ